MVYAVCGTSMLIKWGLTVQPTIDVWYPLVNLNNLSPTLEMIRNQCFFSHIGKGSELCWADLRKCGSPEDTKMLFYSPMASFGLHSRIGIQVINVNLEVEAHKVEI